MTRKEFVEGLLKKGKTTDEIFKALGKGDIKNGVKPIKDPRFIKLVGNKLIKQIKEK